VHEGLVDVRPPCVLQLTLWLAKRGTVLMRVSHDLFQGHPLDIKVALLSVIVGADRGTAVPRAATSLDPTGRRSGIGSHIKSHLHQRVRHAPVWRATADEKGRGSHVERGRPTEARARRGFFWPSQTYASRRCQWAPTRGQRGYQNSIFIKVAHAPLGRATANENG
jgi:hypothetical protein